MQSIFIVALAVSLIYTIFKYIEMRFITKKNVPLKILFRDTLLVYLSVVLGDFILQQVKPEMSLPSAPEIFTNDPAF